MVLAVVIGLLLLARGFARLVLGAFLEQYTPQERGVKVVIHGSAMHTGVGRAKTRSIDHLVGYGIKLRSVLRRQIPRLWSSQQRAVSAETWPRFDRSTAKVSRSMSQMMRI